MSRRDDYRFHDRLIRGIAESGDFKISVVKTSDLVKDAVRRHDLSPLPAVILGRTLTAAALMASELKGEERIQLRFDGSGPIGMVLAEANSIGEVRGYVRHPRAELMMGDDASQPPSLGDGLGHGILTVTKTLYNEAEPRHSSIEIVSGDIEQDIAFYMTQSEQIPSAVLFNVSIAPDGSVSHAGGILVQALPGADEQVMDVLQEHLSHFRPVSSWLENGDYIDRIMHEAAGPFPVRELDRRPVHFFCRCSRERFLRGLAMLPVDQLRDLAGEEQELVCQYCGRREQISTDEIDTLMTAAQAALN